MKCPFCNCENEDNFKFCHDCGKPLRSNYDNKRRCGGCGSEIPSGFTNCPFCGENISDYSLNNNLIRNNGNGGDKDNNSNINNNNNNNNFNDYSSFLKSKEISSKKLIIISYIFAIVFGWGGLLIPLFSSLTGGFGFFGIMGLFLPGFMLNSKNPKIRKHAYIQLFISLTGIVLTFIVLFNWLR